MTAEEAYKKILKKRPLVRLKGCLDFGSFFAFATVPFYIKNDQTYLFGTIVDAVDKKTGKVFQYNLLDDVDAYEQSTPVNVKTLFDLPLKKRR